MVVVLGVGHCAADEAVGCLCSNVAGNAIFLFGIPACNKNMSLYVYYYDQWHHQRVEFINIALYFLRVIIGNN